MLLLCLLYVSCEEASAASQLLRYCLETTTLHYTRVGHGKSRQYFFFKRRRLKKFPRKKRNNTRKTRMNWERKSSSRWKEEGKKRKNYFSQFLSSFTFIGWHNIWIFLIIHLFWLTQRHRNFLFNRQIARTLFIIGFFIVCRTNFQQNDNGNNDTD